LFLSHHFQLIPFLSTGGYEQQALMDVIDSTKDLAEGKVKDARYLAKKFMPIMSKVDPEKELFDLVAFDGAANVQKAGRIIKEKFPKVEVIQGAEHLGSLFLSK